METNTLLRHLSRRERQALEIVIRVGSATARDIQQELPDPPSYSAVRSILRILTKKGLLKKSMMEGRDCYTSGVPAAKVRSNGLDSLVRNLFSGSVGAAACALLGQKGAKLTGEEAERLMKIIREARTK